MLYHLQSDFYGNYSTDTSLVYLLDLIKTQIINGNVVGDLMLGVQRVFDCVGHTQLGSTAFSMVYLEFTKPLTNHFC